MVDGLDALVGEEQLHNGVGVDWRIGWMVLTVDALVGLELLHNGGGVDW